MSESQSMDIVVYLSTDWTSSSVRRPGRFGDVEFLRALARLPGVRMLCVNQPVTLVESTLKKPAKMRQWLRGPRLKRLDRELFLFTPVAVVHEMVAAHSAALQRANRWLLGKQVRACLERLDFRSRRRVALIYHPLNYPYFGIAGETGRVYKAWDLYRMRDYPRRVRDTLRRYETEVLAEADVVLTPCLNLYRALALREGGAHFTPPGVDVDQFAAAARGALPEPPEMLGIARPRIGFAGDITERVDLGLIGFLAEARPCWSVVLVGAVAGDRRFRANPDLARCRALGNVHFLGFKEFEVLPAYLAQFDVALLAHTTTGAMLYGHPYKTLQYLAVGKPVVATDIPDAAYYAEVIRIAKNRADFLALVEQELHGDTPLAHAERLAFAARNTWRRRAEETRDLFAGLREGGGAARGAVKG